MLSFAVIPSTVHLNIICDLLTRLSESFTLLWIATAAYLLPRSGTFEYMNYFQFWFIYLVLNADIVFLHVQYNDVLSRNSNNSVRVVVLLFWFI